MIPAAEVDARARILVVEDDALVARDVEQSLEGMGYAVVGVAGDAEEALALAGAATPDLVLMDIRLPGSMDGIEAGERMVRDFELPVVFLTAHSDNATLQRAKEAGSFGYLIKPFESTGLKAAIEIAVHHHRMASLLRESEERFRVTLRSMRESVVVVDDQGAVTFMNPSAEFLLAQPASSVVGRPGPSAVPLRFESAEGVPHPIRQALDTGMPVFLSQRVAARTAHGRFIPVSGSVSPIRDARGVVTGAAFVFRDATIERQMEDTLRAQEARYRRHYEGGLWGMFEVGAEGLVVHANDAFGRMLGLESGEEAVGVSFASLLPVPVEFEYLNARARHSGEVRPHERRLRKFDGGTTTVVLSLRAEETPLGMLLIGRAVDLTEQKLIDERIQRQHDLEAVGTLAAGVAHEFNNLLTVIRGHVDLLREDRSDESEELEAITTASERAAALVDRLMTVGHGSTGTTQVVHVADALQSWMETFRREAHDLSVEFAASGTDWWVATDRTRLKDAILALVENAVTAVLETTERRGGTSADRTIRIGMVEPIGELRTGKVQFGPFVGIFVEDRGVGMDPETLRRAPEAFYSTWPGRTGLGLAAAQGFAEHQGGWLEVSSSPGVGTVATLYLPIARIGDVSE